MPEVPLTVAVRVRPLLAREVELLHNSTPCVHIKDGQLIVGGERAFTFDHIFDSNSTQSTVFDSLISPIVDQCFLGYNATIFAYGQTGSGKTFTMEGNLDSPQMAGLIPRAVEMVFSALQSRDPTTYTVRVSFIEIYKEDLHDLLDGAEYPYKTLHIRDDDKGRTLVVNAREIECETISDVLSWLDTGCALRRTEATRMNERSSRSHSIFTLVVDQRRVEKSGEGDFISAKLHFVDLAGSERVQRTGNVGERFKESVHINTGLLALGNVISALSDVKKRGHVPYRDAKITRLLKDALGGNAHTAMIACVSPAACNLDETLNTLKYAGRARHIRNEPVVNRHSQSLAALQSEVTLLREALQREKSVFLIKVLRTGLGKSISSNVEIAHSPIRTLLTTSLGLMKDIYQCDCIGENIRSELRSIIHTAHTLGLTEELNDNGVNGGGVTSSRKSVAEIRVAQLEQKVRQYEEDLALDEQIFSQKAQEAVEKTKAVEELKNTNSLLNKQIETLTNENRILNDEIMTLKLTVNDLQNKIADYEDANSTLQAEPDSTMLATNLQLEPRPTKSAPIRARQPELDESDINARRLVAHTTPAVYTMERIVESFRAKCQILAARLDDQDVVLVPNLDNKPPEVPSNRNNVQDSHRIQDSNCLPEMKSLRSSVSLTKEQIEATNSQIRHVNKKMRDLALNIKLKEELIRELVKTSRESEQANKTFGERIKLLERDKENAKRELFETQKQLTKIQHNNGDTTAVQAKLELAKTRVFNVKKKQKDAEAAQAMVAQGDKRVSELLAEVHRMKSHQELLTKRNREELERKQILEKEHNSFVLKIKDLETKVDQQQKLLRRKNEEVAALKKRGRSSSSNMGRGRLTSNDDVIKQAEREMERVLESRRRVEVHEKQLQLREEKLAEREKLCSQKNVIDERKLRTSQTLASEVISLAKSIDQSSNKELSDDRQTLFERKIELEMRLQEGNLLSQEEEQTLMQLNEAIDAVDVTLKYSSQVISSFDGGTGINLSNEFLDRLMKKNPRTLLRHYLSRVIDHKEIERAKDQQLSILQVEIEDQRKQIDSLESALQTAQSDAERRITAVAKEAEQNTQLLLRQLGPTSVDQDSDKIKELERDLYYYKKTSRDLKKRLREMVGNSNDPDLVPTPRSDEQLPSVRVSKQDVRELTPAELASRMQQISHSGDSRHREQFIDPSSNPWT